MTTYWADKNKPSVFDDWDSMEIPAGEATTLRVCPQCGAMIRNRTSVLEQHRDWHRSAGV